MCDVIKKKVVISTEVSCSWTYKNAQYRDYIGVERNTKIDTEVSINSNNIRGCDMVDPLLAILKKRNDHTFPSTTICSENWG